MTEKVTAENTTVPMFHYEYSEPCDVEWNEDDWPLWGADPKCKHEIRLKMSGYACGKCSGWFCL